MTGLLHLTTAMFKVASRFTTLALRASAEHPPPSETDARS